MFRYVTLMWDADCQERCAAAREFERRVRAVDGDWKAAYTEHGIAVLIADSSPDLGAHRLCAGGGVVVGNLFERQTDLQSDRPAKRATFDERSTLGLLLSQGRGLTTGYWGNYVAFLNEKRAGMHLVIKDPVGTLSCHFVESRGIRILFSCLADYLQFGVTLPRINWDFVKSRTINGLYDVETDPFQGISTVHRGECVSFDGRGCVVTRSQYWHPTGFADAEESIDDPRYAAAAIRATVRSCVHSLAASHSSVLQQASGGLDSSIVAGCLSDAPSGVEVTCYTNYVRGSPCDERRWARYVTERAGFRHVELGHEPAKFVIGDFPDLAPSMYPPPSVLHWVRGRLERDLAERHRATAVFTGEGGDSVFCSTSYALAVDHSLRRHGFGVRTLRVATLTAARRDRTVYGVLIQALKRRLLGNRLTEFRRLLSNSFCLIHPDLEQSARRLEHFPNPWFSGENRVDLESIWRLGTIAFASEFYDLSVSANVAAPISISPLCAQPVYELCRRIPIDIHFEGGRMRGLARRAFAGLVPASNLRRQWKDRPLSQPAEIVNANLAFIRQSLLEGKLSQERILDRARVELALKDGPIKDAATSGEILMHLDMEMWIRRLVA